MKKILLVLALLAVLLTVGVACGKGDNTETTLDPNAVLTDSNVPLDLGAQIMEVESTEAAVSDLS